LTVGSHGFGACRSIAYSDLRNIRLGTCDGRQDNVIVVFSEHSMKIERLSNLATDSTEVLANGYFQLLFNNPEDDFDALMGEFMAPATVESASGQAATPTESSATPSRPRWRIAA